MIVYAIICAYRVPSSLEAVKFWTAELQQHLSRCSITVAANKSDLLPNEANTTAYNNNNNNINNNINNNALNSEKNEKRTDGENTAAAAAAAAAAADTAAADEAAAADEDQLQQIQQQKGLEAIKRGIEVFKP